MNNIPSRIQGSDFELVHCDTKKLPHVYMIIHEDSFKGHFRYRDATHVDIRVDTYIPVSIVMEATSRLQDALRVK